MKNLFQYIRRESITFYEKGDCRRAWLTKIQSNRCETAFLSHWFVCCGWSAEIARQHAQKLSSKENMGQQSEGKSTMKCRVNIVADIFAVCGHILFCRVPIVQLCITATVIEPNQVWSYDSSRCLCLFHPAQIYVMYFLFIQGFVCYTGSCSVEHVLLVFSCPSAANSMLLLFFPMQNCHNRIEELMSVRIYVFGFVAVVVAAIMVRTTRQTPLGFFFLCFF